VPVREKGKMSLVILQYISSCYAVVQENSPKVDHHDPPIPARFCPEQVFNFFLLLVNGI